MLKFFKNFRVNIATRVGLLTGSIFIFTSLLTSTDYVFTPLGIGSLIVFQVISIIRQTESTNKDFIKLLNYIKHDDFSNFFHPKITGETFENFNDSLNQVIKQFKEIRAEKEAQYQYLRTIIQYIGIGIISFDKTGKVQLINNAAKKLFMINNISHIDNCESCSPEMVEKFKTLKTGEKALVKLFREGGIIEVAVRAIELTLQGKEYRLITVQNIHAELEEKELEAWQNLVRVLTHEIMNSVAPITSLSATIRDEITYFKENIEEGESISLEELDDVHLAAQTIHRRGNSLVHFVNEFRFFAKKPQPQLKNIKIQDIFQHVATLMKNELDEFQIHFHIKMPPASFYITADSVMIEQVLINLIKNGIQALGNKEEAEGKKSIWLHAAQNEQNRPVIIVKDNGPGIDNKAMERIFIPFFSTKATGSGIGLSLSRQIMKEHKGTITVKSTISQGAEFTLQF
jgi:nitrogen fixation/metabolism regulation signal transduction histidine kinase